MYITLTEGSSTHSEKSTEEIAKARAAGEPWGARHIFYPAIPATAQATQAGIFLTFISSLGPEGPELPPAICVTTKDPYSWARLASTSVAWCQMVENETGQSVVYMTTQEFADNLPGFPFTREYVIDA